MSACVVSILFVTTKVYLFDLEAVAKVTAEFEAFAAQSRALAVRGAKALGDVERTGAHFAEGRASLVGFAEAHGLGARYARDLSDMWVAMQDDATVEGEVLSGVVPVENAAVLGKIAVAPPLVRGNLPWREWARTSAPSTFREAWARRRAEVNAAETLIEVRAYLTTRAHEEVRRTCDLMSRSRKALVTVGEAVAATVREWLAANDPMEREPRERRVGDTSGEDPKGPRSRYVAAEVDRRVRARTNDRCAVPGCRHSIWVERSHRVAHVLGGDREAHNIDLLCRMHHFLYEVGALRITGPPDAPVFTDAFGHVLRERAGPVGDVEGGGGAEPEVGEPLAEDGVADDGTRIASTSREAVGATGSAASCPTGPPET
jgi:hypothetical protein